MSLSAFSFYQKKQIESKPLKKWAEIKKMLEINVNELNYKEVAYMATQYDDKYHTERSAVNHAIFDECLTGNYELIDLYNQYCSNMGYEEYYTNDGYTLNELLEGVSPQEIIQKVYFGKFFYNDEYFTFDGYGSIESISEKKLIRMIKHDSSFIEWALNELEIDEEFMKNAIDEYERLLKLGY